MFASPDPNVGVNHSDICWRDNTAGHKQPRRFLEFSDNFFQVIKESTRTNTEHCFAEPIPMKGLWAM